MRRQFGSVLVANRGEIAVRIIRAVREAALRSVAVYSDADRDALHAREADTAVHIGPTAATESYLSTSAILAAALESGAEAIHPGYGFLSERSEFARAVEDAGLVFIGPSSDVMDLMGRKDHAREIAIRAGVPVTPQYDEAAIPAGAYPVLVKAAAGGGGKGMRIVRDAGDLPDAVAAARRESLAAFGDDTLLFEKYVEAGRHVEVQVLGDQHGNVVHFFERDCSVQRRHQKVLEEAPAPTISDQVRETLTESAVALAREVDYVSTGTVEFLVSRDEIAFLEMNTRLQVEHPVTELICGRDLVQLQFAVAAGETLPLTQQDVTRSGHAIEARVYAEDPYAGFLPQAGRADLVRWPGGARVDAALESGQEVSTAYDPMLGKVIVHARDREAARQALVRALDDTAVLGLTTNTGFLRAIAASEEFSRAEIHTAWLDSDPGALAFTTAPETPGEAAEAAAQAWAGSSVRTGAGQSRDGPFGVADGWRSSGPPTPIRVELLRGTEQFVASFDPDDVHAPSEYATLVRDGQVTVALHGQSWSFERPDPLRATDSAGAAEAQVVAPMPGTVLSVEAAPGVTVSAGDVLGVVEAMKMELALRAPYDGIVSHVGADVGAQVALGQVLFVVDPAEDRSTS